MNENQQLADIIAIRNEQERTLDFLINKSDEVFDETAIARKKLEDKLSFIIDGITIEDGDNAKAIDAKVSLFKAYDDILTNREKAFERRISIRQKQKVTDTASQISDIVTEALMQVGFNEEYVPSATIELSNRDKELIDKKLEKLNDLSVDDITDGEISRSVKK